MSLYASMSQLPVIVYRQIEIWNRTLMYVLPTVLFLSMELKLLSRCIHMNSMSLPVFMRVKERMS